MLFVGNKYHILTYMPKICIVNGTLTLCSGTLWIGGGCLPRLSHCCSMEREKKLSSFSGRKRRVFEIMQQANDHCINDHVRFNMSLNLNLRCEWWWCLSRLVFGGECRFAA